MRLFVAIWPPPTVRGRLGALARPAVPGLRWTTADQWHVTLAFLGEVPDGEQDVVAAAIADVAGRLPGRPHAVMGPATETMGRGILCVPVDGLDVVAAAVRASPVGRYVAPGEPPFSGHLTLARARRGRRVPDDVCGMPVDARWSVDEVCAVSSRL
ncbi:MAG TPA: 2'-5' RNA ligase family protein, partial [Acidimicrobiales bacterium]